MTGPAVRPRWWRGARGEWYVVAQLALMALVFLGPRHWGGWPAWRFPLARLSPFIGIALAAAGALLFVGGLRRLGRALTPLPYPRDDAVLVETGPYALVRHPIYGGGILVAIGWAIAARSWPTLAYTLLLFVFFDIKSRREERWLRAKFPTYRAYQQRVRKLVPFLY